ncbi:tyrosine-type recombinase/integrase [Sulfurimonas marina]|uniref:Site-specific integrase n=1 Tax=Sulfurimonas marina TaxID=2590551 RepID=A0A7M1AWV0_9BACT|nr:tyrosine-type recombinase/integrase [Sulfurimonas marina]QOP41058.1 site-specific integrase [Sulfurimonas marina]
MGMRSMKAKKYKGLYEYYRDSDKDKRTVAYYIQYRGADGKPTKIKTNAKDKDEALAILQAKKAEVSKIKKRISKNDIELENRIRQNSISLDDAMALFHAQRTNKNHNNDLGMYNLHIKPMLGNKKLSKIQRTDLITFKEHLEKKISTRPKIIKTEGGKQTRIEEEYTLSPSYIRNIFQYMRAAFNWMIEEKYIDNNPVVVNKIVNQIEDNEPGRVLTDDELEKLWNLDEFKINDRLFLFLKTCYFTGARPAGVIDIKVKDINFNTKRIKIKAMKKGKSYEAPIPDELLDLLNKWINKHNLNYSNFIFYPIQMYIRATTLKMKEEAKNKPANYSGYRRAIQKILDPIFNKGIDAYDRMFRVTVYTLRRTAGTKVYRKYGLVHAKEFLNHTDVATTMKYLNVKADMQEVTDAL